MPDETPLEPRFVVWLCDHCREGIEFDAVQLADREVCRVPCPHCGQETSLQEPAPEPPPKLIPDEGWALPSKTEAPEVTVTLPPDPPPPAMTRAPMDVRWLTDLGVAYFRQHQFHEAYLCFSRAAEQGFAAAQFCVAACYLNGQGTAQNEAAALPWLREAAAQGDANAEFTLGMAYRLGRGVVADPELASQWLRQAAGHGHVEARTFLGGAKGNVNPVPAKTLEPTPPTDASAESSRAETPATPRQDLQRLILGLFRKK